MMGLSATWRILFGGVVFLAATGGAAADVAWRVLSSDYGDLPLPSPHEATASLILDVDKDGVDDFVIGGRNAAPALSWYRRNEDGWTAHVIEGAITPIEAGGAFHDIDGDGDLDIAMGGDYQSNEVWWWENPYPAFDPDEPWVRHVIKASGSRIHHNMGFADVDGDGVAEFILWNQGGYKPWTQGSKLLVADIPSDPTTDPWEFGEVFEGFGEGMAYADFDGDGRTDILAGPYWHSYSGPGEFKSHVIDGNQIGPILAAGDLNGDGRPDVVMNSGDFSARLTWYENLGEGSEGAVGWRAHDLLGFDMHKGHTLSVGDINGDGALDIFAAEMALHNEESLALVFYGDGRGAFRRQTLSIGAGDHESKLGDLDGDGDLDILRKPFWDASRNERARRIDILLNDGPASPENASPPLHPLNGWVRHEIDHDRPGTAIFVKVADMDGDGLEDIVTGSWWYRNPGRAGPWLRRAIGSPLYNMADVADFDGDGDLDVLGTQGNKILLDRYKPKSAVEQFAERISKAIEWRMNGGKLSVPTNALVWAENDGAGGFTLHENFQGGMGPFLQGAASARLGDDETVTVALAWNAGHGGLQFLKTPADPARDQWTWNQVSPDSFGEGLDFGDIDRDGDLDLLEGFNWVRNDGGAWTDVPLHTPPGAAQPDRNFLVDMDGDGDLDALIGYGHETSIRTLAWYEQGADPAAPWAEHVISNELAGNPQAVNFGDVDGDGDIDVVAGEHSNPDIGSMGLFVFENVDGAGKEWRRRTVHIGDEHHDGPALADLDGDGDLDVISIGWMHNSVLIYENRTAPTDRAPGAAARDWRSLEARKTWTREVIERRKPARSVLMETVDLNADGFDDIVTGAWWYQNPGAQGGGWRRNEIGAPLNNFALAFDVDDDGDVDLLGSAGLGDTPDGRLAWAENDGRGGFTVRENIEPGGGNFLQGATVARFADTEALTAVLSWQDRTEGVQMIAVPPDPIEQTWSRRVIVQPSDGEGLDHGDIDEDGDLDLLLGTRWLRKNGDAWRSMRFATPPSEPIALRRTARWVLGRTSLFGEIEADRLRLADMDGDGDLDAVMTFASTEDTPKPLMWYEKRDAKGQSWIPHTIGSLVNARSLDVADVDGDGDLDVVAGEHSLGFPERPEFAGLVIFENLDGEGRAWSENEIHTGDEHHDGAKLVDIDNDGDLDVISMGWTHGRIAIYRNPGPSGNTSSNLD